MLQECLQDRIPAWRASRLKRRWCEGDRLADSLDLKRKGGNSSDPYIFTQCTQAWSHRFIPSIFPLGSGTGPREMTKFQYQTGDPGSASSLFFPANDPETWSLLEAFPVGKIRVLQFLGSLLEIWEGSRGMLGSCCCSVAHRMGLYP